MNRDIKIFLGLADRLINLLGQSGYIFFKERPGLLLETNPLNSKEENDLIKKKLDKSMKNIKAIRAECKIEREQCDLEIKMVCEAIEKAVLKDAWESTNAELF